MSAMPRPSAPGGPCSPCGPCGPSGPSGPCGPSGPSGPTRFMSRVQVPLSFRNRSPVLVFRYTSPGCPSLYVGSVAPLKNRMPPPPPPPPAIGIGLLGETLTTCPSAPRNLSRPSLLIPSHRLCASPLCVPAVQTTKEASPWTPPPSLSSAPQAAAVC